VIRTITAHANPLIKRLRSLHDKRDRQSEGLFLAEGLRILIEALEAGQLPQILLFGPDARGQPLLERLIAAVDAAGGEVIETSREVLCKVARKDNPQSVVGAFVQRRTELEALDRDAASLWIVLEGIRDPGNLGTILRLSDAIGAGGVILLDTSCDPFSVETVRATMGALFTQPIVQTSGADFLYWLRQGPGFLAGAIVDGAVDYQALTYPAPTFLLMGNEQSGLPASYQQAVDARVRIPMRGKADSLNVAVATAVLAYEIFNQHRKVMS
jgi:RNA methyltransferase, TrmH family